MNDVNNWKPFYSKKFPKTEELKSVQVIKIGDIKNDSLLFFLKAEVLRYKSISDDYLKQLELVIEKTLVSKIESWREHRMTRWNR